MNEQRRETAGRHCKKEQANNKDSFRYVNYHHSHTHALTHEHTHTHILTLAHNA